jgi:photosystem II stability/assembly factor-like uncharacterized protein
MKKTQFVFAILALFLCIQAQSQENSKWKSIGPFGGSIDALSVNPQNLNECFAIGNSSGSYIYRSTNGGRTWANLYEFSRPIYDMVVDPIDPDVLYVLSNEYLYKSIDNGKTWDVYPFDNDVVTRNGRLAINSRHPNTLYAIGKDANDYKKACILKSLDGAETWTSHSFFTAPDSLRDYSLAISRSNPNVLYSTLGFWENYTYESGCVFKSNDGGQSWEKSSETINHKINVIAVDPLKPNTVYIGTDFTVFRSTDGGQSWHQSEDYVYSTALLVDPTNTNIIYAGHDNCSYKSEDGGIHWTRYQCGNLGSCRDLLSLRDNILFASDIGIFRSSNRGENWEFSHKGISKICIKTVSTTDVFPTTMYALPYNGEKLYKSVDFGITWNCSEGLDNCGRISWVEAHPDDSEQAFITTLGGG